MARTARASVGGVCYHVLNRGNAREEVFYRKEDYAAFLDLMEEAEERLPMRLLAWCLIANHFHLVLWPRGDGETSTCGRSCVTWSATLCARISWAARKTGRGLRRRRWLAGNVRQCCTPNRFPATRTGSIGSTARRAKRNWRPCGSASSGARPMDTSRGNMPQQSVWAWKQAFTHVGDPDCQAKVECPLAPRYRELTT
ncbi:MAG: transposase [Planctomycetia bacterium]|nr:transposase [Planctomycetia bacterium]